MAGTRAWFSAHATVADGFAAAALAALSVPATLGGDAAAGVLAPGTGVAGLGWLWFAAVHLPLVWRRHAPVVSLWTVLVLVLGCAAAGVTGVFLVFVPIVAVYTVARHASARALLAAVAAVTPLLGSAWLREPGEWPTVLATASLTVAAACGGAGLAARRRLATERERHRRQRLELDARAAVAAERARLAREVHDVVGHNLAVMVALADGAAATIGSRPERAEDMMDKAAATGREALGELRRVVKLLRDGDAEAAPPLPIPAAPAAVAIADTAPVAADPHAAPPAAAFRGPLAAELERLTERVRLAGRPTGLTLVADAPEPPPEVAASALRVVQESVTNVLKHAGPGARVRIAVRLEPAAIDIAVTDDGAATGSVTPTGDHHPGHGLAGLAERVAGHGGGFEAGPVAAGGWRVHARLPHCHDEIGDTTVTANRGRSEPA